MRALDRTPENRFVSAKEMGAALRRATDVAHAAEIADWLRAERTQLLEKRERSLAALKRATGASTYRQVVSNQTEGLNQILRSKRT